MTIPEKILASLKTLHKINAGAILVVSMVVSSIANLVFNAYMGRTLSHAEYFVVSLVITLYNIFNMIVSAVSNTVNHQVSELHAQHKQQAVAAYLIKVRSITTKFAAILTVIMLALSPLLAVYFNNTNLVAIVSVTAIIIFLSYNNIIHAGLQGMLLFKFVAILFLVESLSKLIIGVWLAQIGFGNFSYLAVSLSIIATSLVAYILIRRAGLHHNANHKISTPTFEKKFFFSSLIITVATSAFLNIDILIAGHYLSAEEAGKYALLSLTGKLIFFFGSLLNVFTITLTTHAKVQNKSHKLILYRILSISSIAMVGMYLVLGIYGHLTAPLLFGDNAKAITSLLPIYTLAMTLYTISTYIVNYHLALKHYSSALLSISSTLLLIIITLFYNNNITEIAIAVLVASVYNIIMLTVLHIGYARGKFILSNILDFIDLFTFKSERTPTDKYHILILNWRDTSHINAGGAEVYVHELAKRWVTQGHAVSMIAGNDGHSLRNETIDGVQIIRRGGFFTVYLWAFLYYLAKFRGKVDCVIESQNGAPFLTPWYVKEKQVAIIHHINQGLFKRQLPKPLATLACLVEKYFTPHVYHATQTIVVSPSTKKELHSLLNNKRRTHTVYNGVDTQKYKPGQKAFVPTILYLGRLKAYKRVDLLIEAAKQLQRSMPAFQCIIAGEGEEREKLEKLVVQYGLKPNVIFKGKVSEDEKVKLYQQAWLTVNPSMIEGWGITCLEANACGTPIVAFNVPGLKDAIKNNYSGVLIKTQTASELADACAKILQDEQLRATLSATAILWSQNFSWEKSAKRGLKIITQGVEKRPQLFNQDLVEVAGQLAYDRIYK